MVALGSHGFFDLYFIPFLLFYITYFIDKYFFRLFLSISKTRAALGAGIINAVCAAVVCGILYFFAHLILNEAICFMSIPDIYCLARFKIQGMPFIPFIAAFGSLVVLKLFIFMHVFEEKKSWFAPLVALTLSRAAMFGSIYFCMQYLQALIAYGLEYMSLEVFMVVFLCSLFLFDYLCSLLFKTKEEDF